MERLRDIRLYPLWVLLIGALVLLPGLGSYGLWEPNEVAVASRANEIANAERLEAKAAIAGTSADDLREERERRERRQVAPELTAEIVAWGLQRFGGSEGGGRLPLALLALLAIVATYFIGFRVGGHRAGLIAGVIAASLPLIILEGRHLTSDIGSIAGTALLGLGAIGLLTRRSFGFVAEHRAVHYAIDAALIAAGLWLADAAAGLFLGVLPPLAGCALAAGAVLLADRGRRRLEPTERLHLYIGGGAALAGAVAAFAIFFAAVFDVHELPEGDEPVLAEIAGVELRPVAQADQADQAGDLPMLSRLTGLDFEPEDGYVDALGGAWRDRADLRVGFSTILEQLAYGTFPWIAIIPIAIAAGFARRREDDDEAVETHRAIGVAALALWALAAYVVASVFFRKVGGATYPAVVALAAIAGVWLDRVMPQPAADDGRSGEARGGLPLVALFAVACAVVVGRDLVAFAEKLTSLNLPRTTLAFPEGVSAHVIWIGVGWAAALAVAVALLYRGAGEVVRSGPWYRWLPATAAHQARRGGVIAGLALGVVSALVLAQVVTPALSKRLSTKNILAVYEELAREGDQLGIMGGTGGAAYYAGEDYEEIRGRTQLVDFLRRDQRVFALAPKAELCPLNKVAREKKFPFYVVDSSSAKYSLFSNKLLEGETDENPLAGIFVSEPPDNIRRRVSFNLDNQLELIGYSMPDSARRGSTFTMRLYFKVLKRVSRNWKMVLVHFDKGVRFQADHEPIGGVCGTVYWVPGDIVIDEFEVTAGSRAHPYGEYQVYTGLFVGSAGNWTNMKVIKGGDKTDRIPLGKLKLR